MQNRVQIVNDPVLAVEALGLELGEWRRVVCEIGDSLYPGMEVAPPLSVYDLKRPKGWPSYQTFLRSAGLPKSSAGWTVLLQATTGRTPATISQSANMAWVGRRARPRDEGETLTDAEKRMASELRRRGDLARRSKRARKSEYRPSYRVEYFGAMEVWRSVVEWRPTADGWDYVEIGAESVWQLI